MPAQSSKLKRKKAVPQGGTPLQSAAATGLIEKVEQEQYDTLGRMLENRFGLSF
jgi:hypothetical protein